MPQLFEKTQIRAILETERPWSAFALGDLEPQFFVNSTWFGTSTNRPSLALLYAGFAIPILLMVGGPDDLRPVLVEMKAALDRFQKIYAVVKPDAYALLEECYSVLEKREMYRMVFDESRSANASAGGPLRRLERADADAMCQLFRDGETSGEAPEWFTPEMLIQGTYFGVFENGALIAAGGTHVLSVAESIAGLGNIYTRRDRRRRGLAAAITNGIINHLWDMRIRTIVLNVRRSNDIAVRLYERLGFRLYCEYYEAIVVARS
jgi:GNAT superfamily N-acetyltransferase